MARYLATGNARLLNRRVEMMARRADGTEVPGELAITRIPTPGPPQFTAYLRDITERKSLERRRGARLAVTQVLAQAPTLAEAAPRILQAVCESLGWDLGGFWMVDRPANVLRCQEIWHTASIGAEAFTECCGQRTFAPGIGLPGRVWNSGRPAWIPDVTRDTNFPRASIAVAEGLHGAFAAPILSGPERLGVIEFFSREIREPDPDLLEMMATIGSQIGQFVDRKQAEEELRRLAAIVESSNDAIISKDLDGIILSWNGAAERLYGYTAAEIIGKPLAILVPPDHPDELPAIMERLKRGERIERYETVRVCKDGRRVDVSLTISPVRGVDGRIIGASKIARDITARKQAEEKLRESEERLRGIFSQTLAGVAQTDLTGRFVQVNERYCQIVGHSAEQLYGLRMQDITHAEDMRRNLDLFLPLVQGTGQPFVIENRYVRPDGSEVWVNNSVSLVRDRHGQPKYVVAVSLDITDRKRAEQRAGFLADASATLAELTDYESTLQRIASLAVPRFADWCVVDMQEADGSVRHLAVTHSDPAKVQLAREFLSRYPPLPTDPHGVMAILRSGRPEWSAAIPDSSLVDLTQDEEHLRILRELGLKSYIGAPLASRTKVLGALSFVMAESGRVYDADDLRAAEDLASRAAIAIENATLLAALKETDRRKDEFLAMLAHELRNPLAPIRNAVQIFRAKGPPVPELQWARDVIDRQVQHMTRLVDDLLDVSRITQGKIELRKERVQLATIVNGAVEASRPLIEKWGHHLTVTLPSEPVYLDVDQTRMAQVLLNLLNIAAKYTEQGGQIWLTTEREGEHAVLRVKDTGAGIPPEMLSRIFEMFTQLDRSLDRSQGGLGIGLTLVQSLVEMHGGRVEAHSEGPGRGSEFVVRLPLATEVIDPRRLPPDGDGGGVAATSRCRILVVDDNQDAADSLAMVLRMMGNETHTAHDGLEAVGAAAVFRPDVVLLDIGLPKLNGFEAGRRIREQQGNRVVLIALTGWGQDEDRRRSREAGFDHYLTKPVEFEALQRLLADVEKAKA
jgi:PAS domain S-box-containing protein